MSEDWNPDDYANVLSFTDESRKRVNGESRAVNDKPTADAKWPALEVPDIFAELEPVDYLFEGLDICPGAPTLFAGYGFSGKTMALQSMALSIASGQKIWGCFAGKLGKVLHIDYEQGHRLTRKRYQKLAAGMMLAPQDLGDRLRLVCMPKLYLDSPDSEAFLVKACEGFTMAIIDSFRACSPTIDENDSEARLVLDRLTRVSEKTGCCFIVIHHSRKPSPDRHGGPSKMDIRGSGALFDACASVVIISAEKKGDPATLSHQKARNSGRLAEDMTLKITDVEIDGQKYGGLSVEAEALAPGPGGKVPAAFEDYRKAIIEALSKNPQPTSKNGICALSTGTKTRLLGAIDAMISAGEIISPAKGLYSLDRARLVRDMTDEELWK